MTAQLAFWATAALLAILILRSPRAGVSSVEIWVALLAAPALLCVTLWSTDPFGDFRLRLTAVSVDRAGTSAPFSVGGASTDDLVVPRLPPGIAVLRVNDRGALRWFVAPQRTGESGEAGVARLVAPGGAASELIGSVPILPGDVVCLARCGEARALRLRLRNDGRGMEHVDDAADDAPAPFAQAPLIRVPGWEGLYGWRHWGAEQAIYPLRDYGVSAAALQQGAGCGVRMLCSPESREPVRTFLYRTGAGAEELRIMLLDPGAVLFRGGRAVARGVDVPLEATVSPEVHSLRLYSIVYGSPYRDLLMPGRPGSRIELRAELEPSVAGEALRLALPTPATIPIRRSGIDHAASAAGGGDYVALTITGGDPAASAAVENPLVFERLGGSLAEAVRARLLLRSEDEYGRHARNFEVAGLEAPAGLGERFTVGRSEPPVSAEFMLERLDWPWLAVIAPLLWALFSGRAFSDIWRDNRRALLIHAVVQWLLAIRLLVGIESVALDPGLSFGSAIGGNIAAYVAVPLLLAALAPCAARVGAAFLAPLLFAGILFFLAWRYYGDSTILQVSVAAAAGAAVAAFLPFAGARGARLASWRPTWNRGWFLAIAAIVALIALRLLLFLALNWRERMHIFAPIAISAFYIPAALIAFACALHSAWANGRTGTYLQAATYCIALAAAFVVIPALVGDNGLAIYLLPVMLVTLVVTAPRSTGGRRLAWNLPALALVLSTAWFFLFTHFDSARWERQVEAAVRQAQSASTDEARRDAASDAARLIAEVNDADHNVLRLWTALAPDRITAAGTSEAESQKRVAAILAAYSALPAGRGYLHPSNLGEIRRYQADDNLSAVHLMSPFGRIGAALLLLVLGLLAWRIGGLAAAARPGELAGSLALWTVFCTAAYMIAANLQWVPFTGRNVYLLAGLSASDLIEGAALFLIAMRATAARNVT